MHLKLLGHVASGWLVDKQGRWLKRGSKFKLRSSLYVTSYLHRGNYTIKHHHNILCILVRVASWSGKSLSSFPKLSYLPLNFTMHFLTD